MAYDPRLLAGIVYDSPAKYESANRVGKVTRENCTLCLNFTYDLFRKP
jgi:hypothetical protein